MIIDETKALIIILLCVFCFQEQYSYKLFYFTAASVTCECHAARKKVPHYENKHIQIYWKFDHQKKKIFR